jgi:hypothetical protein
MFKMVHSQQSLIHSDSARFRCGEFIPRPGYPITTQPHSGWLEFSPDTVGVEIVIESIVITVLVPISIMMYFRRIKIP